MSQYSHLQPAERDRIAELKARGVGVRTIACAIRRSPSTISRELRRNATDSGAYRPVIAEGSYLLRRQRPGKLETDERLQAFVVARLAEGWTPEQIAGRLKLGTERGLGSIATETIYAWVYHPVRRAEKLWRLLPRGKKRRGLRRRAAAHQPTDKTSISERSETINTRQTVGHWGEEGPWPQWGRESPMNDLLICKRSQPVLVVHERKTRITLLARLTGKSAAETVSVLMAVLKRLSAPMRGSMTFDNGGEFAGHSLLRPLLACGTYFCDAYASWQKGAVENTNGRLRRWLPRGIDLDDLADDDCRDIALTLNTTPRKCLGYNTPIEAFLAELGKDVTIRFA